MRFKTRTALSERRLVIKQKQQQKHKNTRLNTLSMLVSVCTNIGRPPSAVRLPFLPLYHHLCLLVHRRRSVVVGVWLSVHVRRHLSSSPQPILDVCAYCSIINIWPGSTSATVSSHTSLVFKVSVQRFTVAVELQKESYTRMRGDSSCAPRHVRHRLMSKARSDLSRAKGARFERQAVTMVKWNWQK